MAPKKVNAFFYFMLEWQKEEMKKGRKFPNGIKDVQSDPDCNALWKSLPEAEKARYKHLEKKGKAPIAIKKKTTVGEDLTEVEKAKLKEQVFKDNMSEYIFRKVATALNNNELKNMSFYVIHINYFYSRLIDNANDLEYYPAEISVAECSLSKGVIRILNFIINEKIKLGFTASAKEHSLATHQIPIAGEFGTDDYEEIFRSICNFLEPGKENKKLPPMYTLFSKEDVYRPTKSALGRIAMLNDMHEEFFLLYSFEDLFTCIYNTLMEENESKKMDPIVTAMEIKKDPFLYKPDLECEAHIVFEPGNIHCSQSYIKRWIFVLCKFCCQPLGITMIPGIHKPKDAEKSSIRNLNDSMLSLNLSENGKNCSTMSLTGHSRTYRQRIAEKSQAEKNCSVEEKSTAFVFKQTKSEPIERPLRLPITKSAAIDFETDSESIDLSENSFPSIGRGSALKKRAMAAQLGKGHGSSFRS